MWLGLALLAASANASRVEALEDEVAALEIKIHAALSTGDKSTAALNAVHLCDPSLGAGEGYGASSGYGATRTTTPTVQTDDLGATARCDTVVTGKAGTIKCMIGGWFRSWAHKKLPSIVYKVGARCSHYRLTYPL